MLAKGESYERLLRNDEERVKMRKNESRILLGVLWGTCDVMYL